MSHVKKENVTRINFTVISSCYNVPKCPNEKYRQSVDKVPDSLLVVTYEAYRHQQICMR